MSVPTKLLLVRALTLFALAVVLIGAWTRLADAGLGCPDWPGCYGFLSVPGSEEAVAQANARFPEAPFEAEKAWPEMIHRFVAGLLGLGIFGLALHAVLRGRPDEPRILPVGLALLVVAQAAFGMWTVTLKLWPQVVTLHLLGGFATLSLLWLYALRLGALASVGAPRSVGAAARRAGTGAATTAQVGTSREDTAVDGAAGLRRLALIALLALVAQIALGGWTSSNYAALACPDFPTCQGTLAPAADYARGFDVTQTIGPNYLGGRLEAPARIAIHWTHRLGAVAVTVVLLLLAVRLWRRPPARAAALAVGGLLALQLALGTANVLLSLPLPVAVAHNGVAALLLLAVVLVNYRARSGAWREFP
jgi:cytochrome c oxidase assembly protein subunit 15